MHLIKVIPRGPLAKLYPAIEIGARTAAEAIEGWSRQVGMKLSDNRVMEALGFPDERSLRAPTTATEVHLVPEMVGGGGGFFRIVLGAALIVGGFIVAGMAGPIGPILGKSMIAAGIGMVIGGVMSLFMKAPTSSKENDPDPSKYLGGGTNSTEIGTIIPIGGGQMMIGGHFLSLQVNANELAIGEFPVTPV